jgi:predicted ATPase
VTLVGGGGVGKTRLALEVAARAVDEFPGGTAWVELAPLADEALVLPSAAAALGLREDGSGDASALLRQLVARLSDGAFLLVLDNCEHLLDAAAAVVQLLLQHCPELRVLATSRQRLGLPGEVAWRVPSLSVPGVQAFRRSGGIHRDGYPLAGEDEQDRKGQDQNRDPVHPGNPPPASRVPDPVNAGTGPERLMGYASVQLFVERAAAARPGFRLRSGAEAAAVAEICHRLDGIPLAIELAAARVRVLTPQQIAARLNDRFALLTNGARGALPRHQTLRALIDWSYDSLPEAEAALLRRLSVFAGGWTLEAAEAVASGQWSVISEVKNSGPELATDHWPLTTDILDRLDALVDRSLVLVEDAGEGLRYRMLETVREYAREKLKEAGEEEAARRQHLEFFLQLAEEARGALSGPGQKAALTVMEAELDNLRAALAEAPAHFFGGGAERGEQERGGGGHDSGGESTHFAGTRRSDTGEAAPAMHLQLAAALWPFWAFSGYLTEGRQQLRAALSGIDPAGGDPDAAASTRAEALLGASRLAVAQHDLAEARTFGAESLELFRALDDQRGIARALSCVGWVSFQGGESAAARSQLEDALEICRRFGYRAEMRAAVTHLAVLADAADEWGLARTRSEESLAVAQELGDEDAVAEALYNLGCLALKEGDTPRARALLEQSLEIGRRLGHRPATAAALERLGKVAQQQREYAQSVGYFEEALGIWREMGNPSYVAWNLMETGNAAYADGAYALARQSYEQSREVFRKMNDAYGIRCASNNLGSALYRLGEVDRARSLHRETLPDFQRIVSFEGIAWTLARLGVIETEHGEARRAARLLGAAAVAWEHAGIAPGRQEQAEIDQAKQALQAILGARELAGAWAEGRAMPLDGAVAYALEESCCG